LQSDVRYLTIALLQMAPESNNVAANLAKGDAFCRRAAAMGADIALFPEMWSIGYQGFAGMEPDVVARWRNQALPRNGDYVNHFAALAKELDMAIAISYLEAWEGPPRNSVTLLDRHGNSVLTFAKLHTCDFANFEAALTPGDGFDVCALDTALGPISVGAMICYDREFPESARILMLKDAELVLVPNACGLDERRINQVQSRAYENSFVVAMTNYAAPKNNGQSVVYDPEGNLLLRAGQTEGIYPAYVDLEALRDYRSKTLWGNAYRRPHRYSAIAEMKKSPLFEREDGFGQPFVAEKR